MTMLNNVNPKLTAGVIVGILAASVMTNISFITPDMLHVLGPWAPFITGTISSVLGLITGVYKADTRAGTPTTDTPSDPVPATLPDVAKVLNLPATHLDASGPGNLPTVYPAAKVNAVTSPAPSGVLSPGVATDTPAPAPDAVTITV